jgi:hypothetical protein
MQHYTNKQNSKDALQSTEDGNTLSQRWGYDMTAAFATVCIIFNGLETKKTWPFSHPHKENIV